MNSLSERDKAVLNCIFNPSLPLDEAYEATVELADEEDETPYAEETKKLEIEAVRRAEDGKLDAALKILNEAIEIAPARASLYNNRAQVYQFLGKFDDAFDDLSKAIELAGAKQKYTKCQAFCQRGLILRKAGKIDEARNDFSEAAQMGNQFAKNQLVELNPYAALCNQMLRKVIQDLK